MDPDTNEWAEYKAHLMAQIASALEAEQEIPLLLVTCHNRPDGGIEASVVLTDALDGDEVEALLTEALAEAMAKKKGG